MSSNIDFSSLEAKDVELEELKQSRKAKVVEGPFPGWLTETKEQGKGKMLTVKDEQIKDITIAIRQAADYLGIGSKITVAASKRKGYSDVKFAGKDRRAYKPRTRRTKEQIAADTANGQTDPNLVAPVAAAE